MPKVLVNLTFLAVNNEIDLFLFDFKDYSKLGMTKMELRQKLMVLILARCEDRFKWVEKKEQFPFSIEIPCAPLAQRLEIEALLKTAMDFLWKESQTPQPKEAQNNSSINPPSIDELS